MKYLYTDFDKAEKAFNEKQVGLWAMREAIEYTRETHFLECLIDATNCVNEGFAKAASIALGYAYNHMSKDCDTWWTELDILYEFMEKYHIEPIVE